MAINLIIPFDGDELQPRITVFGVGGAGGNAVNNMIDKKLQGVDFVVANTDAQALQQSRSDVRIQLGPKLTEGLGAGAHASIGAAAAEESIEQIVEHLAGTHMCFITAGMGGGTGTGAAPIIAQAARELGVLTVGVVTKPFHFEGTKRMRQAEKGIEALQKVVDTLIIIPNQNLFRLAHERTTFSEAFLMADDVLYQGVQGITDLMVRPGIINLDFADVRAVMDEMGKAMIGMGEAEGDNRALHAAEKAIANPLLDDTSLKGAKGVLINITGGHDLTLFELDEAANHIRTEVDPDANIIVGSTLDESLDGLMRVSVIATGIEALQPKTAIATRQQVKRPSGYSNEESEEIAAPRALSPGAPSPEAMQRLQAAVARSAPTASAISARELSNASSRFGLSSLIGRMTGQTVPHNDIKAEKVEPISLRQLDTLDEDEVRDLLLHADTDAIAATILKEGLQAETAALLKQVNSTLSIKALGPKLDTARDADDRIEIPAFLRRQAN